MVFGGKELMPNCGFAGAGITRIGSFCGCPLFLEDFQYDRLLQSFTSADSSVRIRRSP